MLFLFVILLFNYAYCQDGYVYNDAVRVSYKFHSVNLRWIDAKVICMEEDARLVMPSNEEEAEAVREVFEEHTKYKKNLKADENQFIFLDSHSHFELNEYITEEYSIQYFYNTWDDFQPDNLEDEKCLAMELNGKLHNRNCTLLTVFICQKEDDPYIKKIQKSSSSYMVPSDPAYMYDVVSEKYFKLHMHQRNWANARSVCHSEGGRLAIIRSKREENFMASMFNDPQNRFPDTPDYAFVGVHDYYRLGEFYTVADEKLNEIEFVSWTPGEPSYSTLDDRCGSITYEGGLNNSACSIPAQFFCEKYGVF